MTGKTTPARHDAILLVGPTGAGKTPLGRHAARMGFQGRRCVHFDFGQQLRDAAGDAPAAGLSAADIAGIRTVLATGALLENEMFPIAATLLRAFMARCAPGDMVILNGLPRHEDQAVHLMPLLKVIRVIHLRCPPEGVYARIHRNRGGDRADRPDDHPDAIRHRLALYAQRTVPLLEFYRRRAVPVIEIPVTVDTAAAALWNRVETAAREKA